MRLPVEEVVSDLLRTLAIEGVAVLVAPPGAGKTTVIPPLLAQAEWCAGKVIVLEPRRVAARAAAARMADLHGSRLGEFIGLRTRGDTVAGPRTRVEVVTEGVLVRMLISDPELTGVSAVVFDEFHERSLDGDVGLAACIETRRFLRPDLRLLIMSATLDATPAAQLLGNAPVISSLGRAFPVDVIWCPAAPGQRWDQAIAATVRRAVADQTRGDVLVFLPGVGEIRRVQALLTDATGGEIEIVELHGALSAADQDRALRSGSLRRVVLATSIAQTSVTLPGVTAVVDGGLARRSRYQPRRGMGGLVTEPVSQAAAEQRRGRAGRVAPGRCYRLWAEHEHRSLPAFDPPEILNADLTGLALDLAARGGIDDDCWLDPPPVGALAAANAVLHDLGAVDSGGITAHGRRMAALGVHPRLAHLVVRGAELGLGATACAVAALLSERDIFTGPPAERPTDLRERLRALHTNISGTDRATIVRVKADARRLQQRLSAAGSSAAADGGQDDSAAGLLLGLGFPDRLARRRSTVGRFVLASGSGASLNGTDPLAGELFLAIGEIDVVAPDGKASADARISIAAPVSCADIESILGDRLVWSNEVTWDRRTRDVVAVRRHVWRSLVVAEDDRPTATAGDYLKALLAGIRAEGLELLSASEDVDRWRERVAACHNHLGAPWPDLSDDALLATLDEWLAPLLAGARRRADMAKIDPAAALHGLLPWPLPRDLNDLAPTHLLVPSGSQIRIDYSVDPPVLAVKLQELFGLTETPRLGGGRIPLVIHLLSPARRPLQVTADLASFWATGYPSIRAEMRGRYPRHPWPQDPTTAPATARTNPRK